MLRALLRQKSSCVSFCKFADISNGYKVSSKISMEVQLNTTTSIINSYIFCYDFVVELQHDFLNMICSS